MLQDRFWNRILLFATSFLVSSLDYPHVTYADWELIKDEQGIKVYTRQLPDSAIKEFKGVTHIKTSLASLVALLDDAGSCKEWMHNCIKGEVLEKISDKERYTYVVNDVPWATDRDIVVHSIISQDPEKKVVTIQLTGVADYKPPDADYVRVSKLKGFWRFTPDKNGVIEVVYQIHMEPGGWLPALLVDLVIVDTPFYTLLKMRDIVKKPKYKNATYKTLKELDN